MKPTSFELLLNSKTFKIPTKFNNLSDVSNDIYYSLIFSENHQYEIKSKVDDEVLESFIKYWVNGEIPTINTDNLNQYSELSSEFCMMQDIIEQKKKELGTRSEFFKCLQNLNSENREFYESQTSSNLDNYLYEYGVDVMSLPISTLISIFNNEKRNLIDHDSAYNLIKSHFEKTGDSKIFELLQSLDCSKLSHSNVRDAIFNKDSRGGFFPKIDNKTLFEIVEFEREASESVSHLERLIQEQRSQIDILVNELDELKDIECNDVDQLMKFVTDQEESLSLIENKEENDIEEMKKSQNDRCNTLNDWITAQNNEFSKIKTKCESNIEKIRNKLHSTNKQTQPQQFSYPSQPQQYSYPSQSQQYSYPSQPQQYSYPSQPQQYSYLSQSQQYSYPSQNQQYSFQTHVQPAFPMQIESLSNQRRQHVGKFTKQNHEKKSSGKEVEIQYDSTEYGRFNGIIRYIENECGGNVHDKGAVEITSSSNEDTICYTPVNILDLDDISGCFISKDKPNSWICLDFGDALVKPTAYSIRSYINGLNFLQNWCVEGSCDGVSWTTLDQKKFDMSISQKGIANTFRIGGEAAKKYYRYLRLTQNGPSSTDLGIMCLSAIEFFGSLIE